MAPETTQIEHACSVSRINHQDHLTAQNGDLMPERENLDLPGLVTAPGQDRELEETTEDEVEEGPQHK